MCNLANYLLESLAKPKARDISNNGHSHSLVLSSTHLFILALQMLLNGFAGYFSHDLNLKDRAPTRDALGDMGPLVAFSKHRVMFFCPLSCAHYKTHCPCTHTHHPYSLCQFCVPDLLSLMLCFPSYGLQSRVNLLVGLAPDTHWGGLRCQHAIAFNLWLLVLLVSNISVSINLTWDSCNKIWN